MGARSSRGDYSASSVDAYQRRYAVAPRQVLDDLALLKEPSKIYLPFVSCRFLRGLALRLSCSPLPASINSRIWGHTAKVIVFQSMGLPTEKVEQRKRELARQYKSIRKQCELIEQKIAKLFRERRTNEAKGRL